MCLHAKHVFSNQFGWYLSFNYVIIEKCVFFKELWWTLADYNRNPFFFLKALTDFDGNWSIKTSFRNQDIIQPLWLSLNLLPKDNRGARNINPCGAEEFSKFSVCGLWLHYFHYVVVVFYWLIVFNHVLVLSNLRLRYFGFPLIYKRLIFLAPLVATVV
jgi:hypothetical protein